MVEDDGKLVWRDWRLVFLKRNNINAILPSGVQLIFVCDEIERRCKSVGDCYSGGRVWPVFQFAGSHKQVCHNLLSIPGVTNGSAVCNKCGGSFSGGKDWPYSPWSVGMGDSQEVPSRSVCILLSNLYQHKSPQACQCGHIHRISVVDSGAGCPCWHFLPEASFTFGIYICFLDCNSGWGSRICNHRLRFHGDGIHMGVCLLDYHMHGDGVHQAHGYRHGA